MCLYRLLTNEVPFDGPNVTNICAKVVRGAFVLPRKLRDEIPEAVEMVIVKCLARDPENRYRDARELGDALTLAYDETLRAQIGTLEIRAAENENEEKKLSTTAVLPRPSSPSSPGPDNTTVPIPLPIPRGVHVTTARTERPSAPVSPYFLAAAIMFLALLGIAALVIGNARRPMPSDGATPEPTMMAIPVASASPDMAPPPAIATDKGLPTPAPEAATAASAAPSISARPRLKTRPSAHPHGSSSVGKEQLYDKY